MRVVAQDRLAEARAYQTIPKRAQALLLTGIQSSSMNRATAFFLARSPET